MNSKATCAVIPKKLRVQTNIKRALQGHSGPCQFEGSLEAEYDHYGEKFCILHLPGKNNEAANKKSSFDDMIRRGIKNFRFINVAGVKLDSLTDQANLSFIGAYLWSL